MEDKNKPQQNFISLSELDMVLRNSTAADFTYSWQSKLVLIFAMKIAKREFPFYATFSPLSLSSDLKVAFYRQRKPKTDEFHFLFLNLDIFRKTSTPGEFAYFRQSEHVGIIALKFQRTRIDFLCDVFAAALFSNFEVPISWHLKYRKQPLISPRLKHLRKGF